MKDNVSRQEYYLTLDQETFEIAGGHIDFSQAIYDWLQAGPNDYRKQAFKAYPIICNYLYTEYRRQFEPIVDQGLSLVDGASNLTGLSTRVIKSLQGINGKGEKSIRSKICFNQEVFFHNLKNIDFNKIRLPGEGAIDRERGWLVIYSLITIANEGWAKSEDNYYNEYVTKFDFYSSVFNLLACNQELWLHSKHLNFDIYTKSLEIMDMVHQFSKQVLFALAFDQFPEFEVTGDLFELLGTAVDGVSCIERVLTQHHSLASLLKLSDQWHKHMAEIDSKIIEPSSEIKWIPLVPEQTIKGLKVFPLISAKMLVEEGEKLQHCVASYTNECSLGKSQIFSIRDKDNVATSTFEIRPHQTRSEVSLIQHQAINNSLPSQEDSSVVKFFLDSINWGAIKIDWQAWREHFHGQHKISKEIKLLQACGYNTNDTELRNNALKAWSFIIPRGLRNLNYNEWAEYLKLPQILKQAKSITKNVVDT